MPSDELNRAIQLIQAGQNEQGQSILQGLIRVNQQDLEVWSWYVRSCSTPEKRLSALELCLRFNPGNQQILEAIQKLREKLAPPPPVVPLNPVPVSPFADGTSPYDFDEETPEPQPSWERSVPAAWESSAPEPISFQTKYQNSQTPEIKKFTSVDTTVDDLEDASGRPLMWYEVWRIALTQPNLPAYDSLLRDPMKSWGRAFGWMFISSLITWLIIFVRILLDPQLTKELGQISRTTNTAVFVLVGMVVFVLFGAIVNVLALLLNAGFYHLLAKGFGGIGTFSRVFYLKAAYNAPFSIASTIATLLLSPIPCIGTIVPVLLEVYYLRLDILSIQAAHRLNGGRATIVVLLPTFALCLLGCVVLVLLNSLVAQSAPELYRILQQAK